MVKASFKVEGSIATVRAELKLLVAEEKNRIPFEIKYPSVDVKYVFSKN